MKTVYLSGKMTGLEESVYKENFRKAELFYRSCGYEVVNPCNLSEVVLKRKPDASYEDFMEEDLNKNHKFISHNKINSSKAGESGSKKIRACINVL